MRFKATFNEQGLRRLERGFLPTLEKCGKAVDILLSPEEINFIQTTVHTDGAVCACARFNTDALFITQDDSFKLTSRHENVVAFRTDLGLLLRAIRSSSANLAETVSIKLIKKAPPGSNAADQNQERKPYLSVSATSSSMSLVQELAVSEPYKADKINDLVESKDMGVMCPYYIDIKPCIVQLQATADRMKGLSDRISVSTAKNGDFYADVRDINVELGVQMCGCSVFPKGTAVAVQPDRSLPVTDQLTRALDAGDAMSLDLSLKHFNRLLTVSSISQPAVILVGIPAERDLLHVMLAYNQPGSTAYDDSMALSIKVPALQAV